MFSEAAALSLGHQAFPFGAYLWKPAASSSEPCIGTAMPHLRALTILTASRTEAVGEGFPTGTNASFALFPPL
jgi:hypothetical protein